MLQVYIPKFFMDFTEQDWSFINGYIEIENKGGEKERVCVCTCQKILRNHWTFDFISLSFPPPHPQSSRFLPSLARSALEKNLADAGIEISAENNQEPELADYKCKYLICFLSEVVIIRHLYYCFNFSKIQFCFPSTLFYTLGWRNKSFL